MEKRLSAGAFSAGRGARASLSALAIHCTGSNCREFTNQFLLLLLLMLTIFGLGIVVVVAQTFLFASVGSIAPFYKNRIRIFNIFKCFNNTSNNNNNNINHCNNNKE